MTDRPRISDEPVLTRWMTLEIAKINRGVVAQRRSLTDLADMEQPTLMTKSGGEYHFDKKTLLTIRAALPSDLSRHLRFRSCVILIHRSATVVSSPITMHSKP